MHNLRLRNENRMAILFQTKAGPPAAQSYREYTPEIYPPPEVFRGLEEARSGKLIDGPKANCTAKLWHGPGHQSSTSCERAKGHGGSHRCNYGADAQQALWWTGDYTNALRRRGIEFNSKSYPEDIGMTGFFDEPPQFLDR